MKLAHLILVHNNPEQVERLVRALAHPDADVYIHLDKKSNIAPFEYLKSLPNIYFVKRRVKVYWGSFSIVQATLNSFKEILAAGVDYDYVNLLSGQDYPLKSADYIHRYLNENKGKAFMKYVLFNPDWQEALARINEYHFNDLQFFGRYTVQKYVNKFLPKRMLPNELTPAGTSQWFTISLECVAYSLDYWDNNKKLRRFIRLTWAPDEFIFQTILFNSKYCDVMVNDDLRYIDWSGGGHSPKVLGMEDADVLIASDRLFARKFDLNKSAALLDIIDQSTKAKAV